MKKCKNKINEFAKNNYVEVVYKENKILLKGIEIKDGHLQSIRQNLLILILTFDQVVETRVIDIPKPEIKDHLYSIDNKSNIPLKNILNKKENLDIIMEILKTHKSVMNTKQSHFLDDDDDNCYNIQGPKASVD